MSQLQVVLIDLILVKTIFFGILGIGEIRFGIKMTTVFVSELQKNKLPLKEVISIQAMSLEHFPEALQGASTVWKFILEVQDFREILLNVG